MTGIGLRGQIEAVEAAALDARIIVDNLADRPDLADIRIANARAAAALSAALETLRQSEWLLIAECPEEWKDGRAVLLGHEGPSAAAYEAHWHVESGAWYFANEGPEDYHASPITWATHWRPLPTPPAAAGG